MKELLYLKDDQLKDLIEKLFVSYRETFSDSKKILDKYSIGLAHHKVIHLLSMYKGISISELLKRLKVTKQSLNRVLKDLIKLEIIIFKNRCLTVVSCLSFLNVIISNFIKSEKKLSIIKMQVLKFMIRRYFIFQNFFILTQL